MIEIKFCEGDYPAGWYRCAICGRAFWVGLEDPLMLAYCDNVRLGEACPQCLEDPTRSRLERAIELEEEAHRLLEQAAELRQVAGQKIIRPTIEQYEGVRKIYENLRRIIESFIYK